MSALREPSSSRFPGDVFSQKGGKAVGHGHREKKSRASRRALRHAAVESESAAITFLVFEDKGSNHCWTDLGPDGSLRNGAAMTNACCASCRIRFTPAAAAYLTACPVCGEPPQLLAGPAEALGYRLFRLEDTPRALPQAIEVSMPIPDPGSGRS
jgi:hypothetical protein